MSLMRKFLGDRGGATAIEYGLIAGLIAVSLIAGLGVLGGNLSNTFNFIATKMNTQ
jgi:pilus assembly protein Flp/PilA